MKSAETIAKGLYALITACFTVFCIFIFTGSAFSKPVELSTNPDSGLSSSSTQSSVGEKTKVRVNQTYGKLPLQFEANEGQTNGQVKFLTRGSGYTMFFTPTESVLVLSKRDEQRRPQSADRKSLDPVILSLSQEGEDSGEGKIKTTAIRMRLEGANPTAKMFGEDILPGNSNYLIGSDPKKWRTNVSNYKKVRYQEVYPGVDLVYYGNQRKLEYDFVVKPGVDPKVIQLSFAGIDNYSVENGGDLVLHTSQGDVTQKKPVIYQKINGKRIKVAGNYIFLDDERVAFHLGDYDKTQPLVIDPVLVYSTFLGSSGSDQGWAIAVDSSSNVYVTGQAGSGTFPTTGGAFDETHNGSSDVFVSKLNVAGNALIYSTFLGSSGTDVGQGIAVNSSGNAYVTGRAGNDTFPTTPGAFDETHNGGIGDMFVSKLNAAGSALIYSTFLGGNGFDEGWGIAMDSSGNAYVTGRTDDNTNDFPTTGGAFDETHNGSSDAFVSKLNPTGSALVYSTFLGSSASDNGFGIAVDSSGNAYVTGQTGNGTFPTTGGAFDETHNGSGDAFVSKLNATGSALVYSTFLGSSNDDLSFGIAVDSSGNAYVTGRANDNATGFPTTPGAFDETNNGSGDAFVSKLNAAGSALVYSTFLGGNGFDFGLSIAVDSSGNAYVTGNTFSTTFPTMAGAVDETYNGSGDVFVSKLSAAGSTLVYSTFLGGSRFDQGLGIAVDSSGNTYVTGPAGNGTFPITTGTFDETQNGSSDVFVSKIGQSGPEVEANAGPDQSVNEGVTVNLDGIGSSPDPNTLNYDWSQVAGPTVALTGANTSTPSFDAPYVSSNQTLTFELIVDDGTNFSDPASVDIVVVSVNSPPVADAGNDSTIKPGAVATLDGSNSFDSESDPITYQWAQVAGTVVTLSDDTAQQPTFTAPNVVGDVLVFKLQVSDGKESSTPSGGTDSADADTVAVTIVANSQPVADAGPDQTKDEGSLVTLSGSGSDSDGGDTLSFQWTQTGGTTVILSSTTSSGPTFTAPAVGPGGEDLTFQLVVTDDDPVNSLSSLPDGVTIHVANINDPPSCNLAVANPENMWPPDHKMISVNIDGVMDADAEYNTVTLQITAVTQDEPVNGLGDGDTSPDAVIQVGDPRDSVLIRSERSNNDNGRVYQLNFTASDGFEGCNGSVEVTVPHSRQSGAVDDGQTVDSTLP